LSLLENGFGNLALWALESFGKVMKILTAQVVRTLLLNWQGPQMEWKFIPEVRVTP
jgi:hypothetical protein